MPRKYSGIKTSLWQKDITSLSLGDHVRLHAIIFPPPRRLPWLSTIGAIVSIEKLRQGVRLPPLLREIKHIDMTLCRQWKRFMNTKIHIGTLREKFSRFPVPSNLPGYKLLDPIHRLKAGPLRTHAEKCGSRCPVTELTAAQVRIPPTIQQNASEDTQGCRQV